MRDLTVDDSIVDLILAEDYKDRRGLSTKQYEEEPWEAIWLNKIIWAARVARRNKDSNRNGI